MVLPNFVSSAVRNPFNPRPNEVERVPASIKSLTATGTPSRSARFRIFLSNFVSGEASW